MRLCHHAHQEMLPPHVHVSVDGASECQVVLSETNSDLPQVRKHQSVTYKSNVSVSYGAERNRQHGLHAAVLH